jgi:hypothetical protein
MTREGEGLGMTSEEEGLGMTGHGKAWDDTLFPVIPRPKAEESGPSWKRKKPRFPGAFVLPVPETS